MMLLMGSGDNMESTTNGSVCRKLLAEAREREAERERKMEEHRQKTEALLQAQIALAEENRYEKY